MKFPSPIRGYDLCLIWFDDPSSRTVLEFVLLGNEGVAWWEGLIGLCAGFGLSVRYLDQTAIEELTRWVLNLSLEYH